jgi:hypothetical protein
LGVPQEQERFPDLFSGHALVPRFDCTGHSLELVAGFFVNRDGNFPKYMSTLPLAKSILRRGEDGRDVKNGMTSFTNFKSC